jgi:thiol:disulfide interchange protein
VLTPSLGSGAPPSAAPAASGPTPLSLAAILVSAFVGGLLLNLMPCVLPVIGLKMFSFMEQAGENRRRVLLLNLWYTLGLLSVFLALATLAVAADLGIRDQNLDWGEQFSSSSFNIAMAGLVFVMALSFLGVWDIPIPGFVGSGKAAELATREGATGAFAKGAMSTVLATPCSGPFLGPVFGFTLSQPVWITYLIFACVGLGMASPYLVIGAFPRLIRLLPKPGAWMDTFKQIMGFLLLGTVVFIFTFLKKDYVVPTFALLIGLWFACWLIGRTPITAPPTRKIRAWAGAAAVAGAVGLFAFTMLTPGEQLLPWKPFSREELTRLSAQGKTVMVDFTADWCLTCKVNLKLAVNTHDVLQEVRKNDVVPLLADWTDGSPEIKDVLTSLGSRSIPVLAIYPASRPHQPIVLRDVISKSQIIDALREAGPSRTSTASSPSLPDAQATASELNSRPPLAGPQ